MDINKLKEINNASTTEELFWIQSPPDYQCDRITAIVKSVQYIEKESQLSKYYDEEDVTDKLHSIYSETYNLDYEVEEVRAAIEGVRTWGQEWKNIVKMIIDKDLVDLRKLGLEIEEMK